MGCCYRTGGYSSGHLRRRRSPPFDTPSECSPWCLEPHAAMKATRVVQHDELGCPHLRWSDGVGADASDNRLRCHRANRFRPPDRDTSCRRPRPPSGDVTFPGEARDLRLSDCVGETSECVAVLRFPRGVNVDNEVGQQASGHRSSVSTDQRRTKNESQDRCA